MLCVLFFLFLLISKSVRFDGFPRKLIVYRHCGAISGNSDHRESLINESQDQESMDREVRTSRDWGLGGVNWLNYHRSGDTLAD